ncbi:MAG: hypothetical protein AB1646_23475 [Thermodesulfobacteriota bacterium]
MRSVCAVLRRIRPGTLSLVFGLAVSTAFGTLGFVGGECSLWRCLWHLFYLRGGSLAELLFHQIWPFHGGMEYCPTLGARPVQILSGFVTWGLFVSVVMYRCLRSRGPVRHAMRTAGLWSRRLMPSERTLRVIATLLLCLGWLLAAIGITSNTYRAATRCEEYSIPFHPVGVTLDAALLGAPMIAMAVVIWLSRSGKLSTTVTIAAAFVFVYASASSLLTDTLASYSPCDRKGDVSAENLFFLEIFAIVPLWVPVFGICAIIDSLFRPPGSGP